MPALWRRPKRRKNFLRIADANGVRRLAAALDCGSLLPRAVNAT
jgi:hypothetical protein